MSRTAAVDAADRIAQRRYDQRRYNESSLAHLPAELLGMVAYVHLYPAAGADPAAEAALRLADAADARLIADHIRGEVDRQQRLLYEYGRRLGMSWSALAEAFGKRSRQSAECEYQRLVAAQGDDGVKDEKVARGERAKQRRDAVRAANRAMRIRELGVALVAGGDRIPDGLDVGYGLEELHYHLAHDCRPGDVPPPGMVAGLTLLVAALRDLPLDAELRAVVDDGAQLLDVAGQ